MRPTRSRSLAASSGLFLLLLVTTMTTMPMPARAETRPHYGGTLRIETQAAIMALPAGPLVADPLAQQVANLTFGDLVTCSGPCSLSPGPFKVAEFVPGKKLTLAANEDYVGGRPYLDNIEILMGRPAREQLVDLQLGRADVIDVPAESMRRASQEGVRLIASSPVELVAVVFSANVDPRVREAVSLTVDRAAIFNVLLGRQGEPTAALLPDWMTGYGFLFDASQNVTRARQLAIETGPAKPITLAYDAHDALARAIVERIALDARAAGLNLTPTTSVANPDAKLIRILLTEGDPDAALGGIARVVAQECCPRSAQPTTEQYYAAERELREKARIVPLLHLPVAYGLSPRVKDWPASRWGGWTLDQVWLEQKP